MLKKRVMVLMPHLFLTALFLCPEGNQRCSPDAGRLPCEEAWLPTGKWQPGMLLTHWVGPRLYPRVPDSLRASSDPRTSSSLGSVLSSVAMLLMYGATIWRWYKADPAGRTEEQHREMLLTISGRLFSLTSSVVTCSKDRGSVCCWNWRDSQYRMEFPVFQG